MTPTWRSSPSAARTPVPAALQPDRGPAPRRACRRDAFRSATRCSSRCAGSSARATPSGRRRRPPGFVIVHYLERLKVKGATFVRNRRARRVVGRARRVRRGPSAGSRASPPTWRSGCASPAACRRMVPLAARRRAFELHHSSQLAECEPARSTRDLCLGYRPAPVPPCGRGRPRDRATGHAEGSGELLVRPVGLTGRRRRRRGSTEPGLHRRLEWTSGGPYEAAGMPMFAERAWRTAEAEASGLRVRG